MAHIGQNVGFRAGGRYQLRIQGLGLQLTGYIVAPCTSRLAPKPFNSTLGYTKRALKNATVRCQANAAAAVSKRGVVSLLKPCWTPG